MWWSLRQTGGGVVRARAQGTVWDWVAKCVMMSLPLPVTGDETYNSSGLWVHTFKSHQWFGASVRSVDDTHLLVRTQSSDWTFGP